MVKKNIRILVSPLDWGIGHATRCVTVIRELQQAGAEVVVGTSGRALEFLKGYFTVLEMIAMPGSEISYPSGGNMAFKMALQAPRIMAGIRKDHLYLRKIIADRKVDAVISDNRFGMHAKDVYSIYITHQLTIKAPKGWGGTETMISSLHRHFIKKYDECWIPDLPGTGNLSGELGHPSPLPQGYFYIGPLSRFAIKSKENKVPADYKYDILFLLSGPEPQRSLFEGLILKELKMHQGLTAVILQGLPGTHEKTDPLPNVTMYSHLKDHEIEELTGNSKFIVCRSGYSTLMDLAALGRSAIVVPTPGQTEQEYLAEYHSGNGSFYSIPQNEFSLELVLKKAKDLVSPIRKEEGSWLLKERIRQLIDRI